MLKDIIKTTSWGLVCGLAVMLSGCGGGESVPQSQTTSNPSLDQSSKVKVKTKGAGGSLVEGGELTPRERRAQKLKEKKAEAK